MGTPKGFGSYLIKTGQYKGKEVTRQQNLKQ
jgi:hypothetical protein